MSHIDKSNSSGLVLALTQNKICSVVVVVGAFYILHTVNVVQVRQSYAKLSEKSLI